MDSKLKNLIKVCKQTGNYKKLAVVGFILTSNVLDEIGIKLGIKPRDKGSEEPLFRYMKLINSILKENLNILLFKEEMVDTIKHIEVQFLKRKGDIPLDYITEIYDIYYDLRKLDIPNLHEHWNNDSKLQDIYINMYSFLSSSKNLKENYQQNKIKPLILHKLKQKESLIQKELNKSYNKDLFENAIFLKKTKNSIKNQERGKIELKGQLKDNIRYQRSLENVLGYSFFGVFILFLLLGLIITLEAILYPSLTAPMSFLFLVTYGMSVLFFVLYWNNFRREES